MNQLIKPGSRLLRFDRGRGRLKVRTHSPPLLQSRPSDLLGHTGKTRSIASQALVVRGRCDGPLQAMLVVEISAVDV
eukprot:2516235-Pyramimonas_sp.AAC.1